jgi:hypothetical protein
MRNFILAVFISLSLGSVVSLNAQSCPSPPADSPIAAPTLDTIPPGALTILTHTGTRAPVTANGRLAAVEMNENEQRVWFGPDTSPGSGKVYYNRRYRANVSSPWYWQYSQSIEIMNLGNASGGPNSVLYSATAKYRDADQTLYKWAMYLIKQPHSCDGVTAGILYVSYSNNGVCWTTPRQARKLDNPSLPCMSDSAEAVPAESVAAIDGGSTIYLMLMEGDNLQLGPEASMDRTAAYLLTASTLNHEWVSSPVGTADVQKDGIVSPASPAGSSSTFKPYNYLMNVDMAYDAAAGTIYITRAYPFAFNRADGNTNVPCPWQSQQVMTYDSVRGVYTQLEGCIPAPATLPNRIQIYKMYIGNLSNITYVYQNPWTLVADLGGDVGYTNAYLGACASNPYAPRTDVRQQNVGRDYAYANFLRDPVGNLKLYSGVPYILAGDSFMLSKGHGECYITGQERSTLVSFPH